MTFITVDRCYGRALKIYPECSSLWHDLGINFLYQSRELSDRYKDENQNDHSEVKVRIQKTVDILKQAITLDPQNCKHWDALGITLCSEGIFFSFFHCLIYGCIFAFICMLIIYQNIEMLFFLNFNINLIRCWSFFCYCLGK